MRGARRVLRDLARSTVGAMNLGLPLLYTMETWWLAWRLPMWVLGTFAFVGTSAIVLINHFVGFDEDRRGAEESWLHLGKATIQLLLTSLIAALTILVLFGIIDRGTSFQDVVRHGLIQVVPLGLGAAVANAVFQSVDDEDEAPPGFAKEMATFALGAAFFAFSVAPTEEMELMAAHAGWWRLASMTVFSLGFTYLVLYVVEFRGRSGRLAGMDNFWLRAGETSAGYAVALVVAAFLLFGYGHYEGVPLEASIQKTVVLAFLAAFGGAAARVVV